MPKNVPEGINEKNLWRNSQWNSEKKPVKILHNILVESKEKFLKKPRERQMEESQKESRKEFQRKSF